MDTKRTLFALVVGAALLVFMGSRRSEPARKPPVKAQPLEAPWLSREAANQIVGDGGTLGPLFGDVMLGGPAPSPAVRARIAEFARANGVKIDLDVADEGLFAVRFAVTFGGCCGYEGADMLALRLRRPSSGNCCACGADTWVNQWAMVTNDGVHVRARVLVNTVEVRWQRVMTLTDVLERADAVLGRDTKSVGKAARDAWVEVESGRSYVLQVPYPLFGSVPSEADPRNDNGLQIAAFAGRIVEVSFPFHESHDERVTATRAALQKHWGRPRKIEDVWTWHRPDRTITVDFSSARITMRTRAG